MILFTSQQWSSDYLRRAGSLFLINAANPNSITVMSRKTTMSDGTKDGTVSLAFTRKSIRRATMPAAIAGRIALRVTRVTLV